MFNTRFAAIMGGDPPAPAPPAPAVPFQVSPSLQGVLGGGDPTPIPPKFKSAEERDNYWRSLKEKYGSQYGKIPVIGKDGKTITGYQAPLDGHAEWLDWMGRELPTGGAPAVLAHKYATALGLNPGDVLASSFVEGVPLRWKDPEMGRESGSTAFLQARQKGQLPQDYSVDGFRYYGLDTLGDKMGEFVQKGYLPKDFPDRVRTFRAAQETDEKAWAKSVIPGLIKNGVLPPDYKYVYNDKNQEDLENKAAAWGNKNGVDVFQNYKRSANAAAFRSDEDAYQAKAAFMRYERDNLREVAKQKGIQLTPEEERFFTMATFNGGRGAQRDMLNWYKSRGLLGKNQFLTTRPESWPTVWDHTIPRVAGSDVLNREGFFTDDNLKTYQKQPQGQVLQPGYYTRDGKRLPQGANVQKNGGRYWLVQDGEDNQEVFFK